MSGLLCFALLKDHMVNCTLDMDHPGPHIHTSPNSCREYEWPRTPQEERLIFALERVGILLSMVAGLEKRLHDTEARLAKHHTYSESRRVREPGFDGTVCAHCGHTFVNRLTTK